MQASPAPIFRDVDALVASRVLPATGRVVLANGCFDPLHVGHVRYLAAAARHGDFLVVALNDDASTRRLKGEARPVVSEGDRAVVLAALDTVDAVVLFDDSTVAEIIERLRPDVHAKGTDYTVETVPELETSRRLGVETVIAGDPKAHSSSSVVEEIRRRGEP